jgi:hypothetical protein
MLDGIVELVSSRDDGESIWLARISARDGRWLELADQQCGCLNYIDSSARHVRKNMLQHAGALFVSRSCLSS